MTACIATKADHFCDNHFCGVLLNACLNHCMFCDHELRDDFLKQFST